MHGSLLGQAMHSFLMSVWEDKQKWVVCGRGLRRRKSAPRRINCVAWPRDWATRLHGVATEGGSDCVAWPSEGGTGDEPGCPAAEGTDCGNCLCG